MRSSIWLTAILAGMIGAAPLLAQPAPAVADTKRVAPTITEVEGKTLAQWIKEMRHDDASAKEEAIRASVLFTGPHGGDLITALLDRCEDRRDVSVRVRTIMALTVLDIKLDEVPRIVKVMNTRLLAAEKQVIVRFHAALCLLRFGKESKDAMQGLLAGADDTESFEVRKMCIRALRECGTLKDGSTDPRVTELLLRHCMLSREPTSAVRLESVIALGSMKLPTDQMLASRCVKMCFDLIGDRDPTISIWATVSWVALDKPSDQLYGNAIRKLKSHLSSSEQRVRLQTIQALGLIGTQAAKTVVPLLIDLLGDKDHFVVLAACEALGNLGEAATPALTALTNRMNEKDVDKDLKTVLEATIKHIKRAKETGAAAKP